MNTKTEIKVRIGNLLNCFPTGRIRKKDMEFYNFKLDEVCSFIDKHVNDEGGAE